MSSDPERVAYANLVLALDRPHTVDEAYALALALHDAWRKANGWNVLRRAAATLKEVEEATKGVGGK
jgi:predicted Zn-dependent protease